MLPILAAEVIKPPSPDGGVESLVRICSILEKLLEILKELPPIARLLEVAYWTGFRDGALAAGAVALALAGIWYFCKKH